MSYQTNAIDQINELQACLDALEDSLEGNTRGCWVPEDVAREISLAAKKATGELQALGIRTLFHERA